MSGGVCNREEPVPDRAGREERRRKEIKCNAKKILTKYKQTLAWKYGLFDGSARRFEAPCLADEIDEDAGEEDIAFSK